MTRAVVAVLLLTLLAGCTAPAEEVLDPKQGTLGPGGSDERPQVRLGYALDQPVADSLWVNATSAVNEACFTGGCVTGAYQEPYDLSDRIPPDVPTLVDVRLTAAVDPVSMGNFDVLLETTGTVYSFTLERAAGEQRIQALVLRGDAPFRVIVQHYWPRYTTTESAYMLAVQTRAENATLLPEVPVAVTLDVGQWLRAETPDGRAATLAMYGPDDAFLGVHEVGAAGLDIQATTGGAHVVVAGGEAGLVLRTNGTARPLAPLPLSVTLDPARNPEADKPTQWTFDLADRPLAVGLYLRTTDTHGAWLHTVDESLTLSGPDGAIIDADYSCTVCLSVTPETTVFAARTGMTDAAVQPGAYAARYDWQGSFGLQVGHFVVRYDRP